MLQDYIKKSWETLRRNSLDVVFDPMLQQVKRPIIYIPASEDADAVRATIKQQGKSDKLDLRILPANLDVRNFDMHSEHGLLYLPHDYVIPGSRFIGMYGWDNYWIILGLLKDGFDSLAVGIIKNFIYEIRYYGGKILNASNTYCLDRSQPPLLAKMVEAVLPHVPPDEYNVFLSDAIDAITIEYQTFWKINRFDAEKGLFHYGSKSLGELGLCPEVIFGERDGSGLTHYDKVIHYLQKFPPNDERRQRFLSNSLTPDAIAGDRAMRESGFDASMHMGPYGLETPDYLPACLNSLLYIQCRTTEALCKQAEQSDRANFFCKEADALNANIQKQLWNEKAGLFSNLNHRTGAFPSLPFLTCAYPLWAKIATPEQAEHFRKNLPLFETPFGLKCATEQTGCQWDAPFMWAPLVYFAVEGLKNYGFAQDAERIAKKFVATVNRVYEKTGVNFEKYNAATGDNETESIINVGYSDNVVGFGWTNAVVSLFLNEWGNLID